MRTIFIGDIHGCADELGDLLDAVKYQSGDDLVFVGDIIVRGPHSRRVIALARAEGARVVRGNHDARVLEVLKDEKLARAFPTHHALACSLRDDEIAFLEATPLWLDFPAHEARAIHGGLEPDKAIHEQDARTLLTSRYVKTSDGKKRLWGEVYEGPPHVVFGHHAMGGLQFHRWATGLDTGCVYGGKLTALVLAPDEPIPALERERRGHITSVAARATYYDPAADRP